MLGKVEILETAARTVATNEAHQRELVNDFEIDYAAYACL